MGENQSLYSKQRLAYEAAKAKNSSLYLLSANGTKLTNVDLANSTEAILGILNYDTQKILEHIELLKDYTESINNANDLIIDANRKVLDIGIEVDNVNTSLSQKANQNDLDATNANVTVNTNNIALKRDKSILLTMNDMGQDVKTAMTGGSVAVVGSDTVGTYNLSTELLNKFSTFDKVSFTTQAGYIRYANGTVNSTSGYLYATIPVTPNAVYRVTSCTPASIMYIVVFVDVNNAVISYLGNSPDNTTQILTDYIVYPPANAVTMYVNFYANVTGYTRDISIASAIDISDIKSKTDNVATLTSNVDDLLTKTSTYTQVDYTTQAGYYRYDTGVFVNPGTGLYQALKVNCNPGDKLRCTTTINGALLATAIFYDASGNRLSYLNQGTNGVNSAYTDYEFVVPANAYAVAIDCMTGNTLKLEKLEAIEVATRIANIESQIGDGTNTNYWKGKKIVWFGTSIPAGFGATFESYPMQVGETLGATIYNEAVGSSCVRAGYWNNISDGDTLGWKNKNWQNIGYALSQSIAEKQELINNWATWKTVLTGTPPDTLSSAEQQKFLDCSYENKLTKYLSGGSVGQVDLYVFDHGYNDQMWTNEIQNVPSSEFDRTYFIGAMNFLLNLILTDNPKARIIIISHYENQAAGSYVCPAQEYLAEQHWMIPYCEVWKKTGWSQRKVTTTGYWDSNSIWQASGGTSQSLTVKQTCLKDDIHPHSDASGKATGLMANICTDFLESVF